MDCVQYIEQNGKDFYYVSVNWEYRENMIQPSVSDWWKYNWLLRTYNKKIAHAPKRMAFKPEPEDIDESVQGPTTQAARHVEAEQLAPERMVEGGVRGGRDGAVDGTTGG